MRPHDPVERVPASLRDRGMARAIDVALLAAVAVGAGLPSGFGLPWFGATLVGVYAYVVLPLMVFGATPGKRLVGVAVVGSRGQRPNLREAAVREAFMLLGAIPVAGPVLAIVAWFAISRSLRTDPTGQGLHDRLAGGTRVVRVPAAARGQGAGSPLAG